MTVNAFPMTYIEQIDQEVRQMPDEYLPQLLQLVRIFRESVTLRSAEASFRQGWAEAMRGETLPVSELWRGIE